MTHIYAIFKAGDSRVRNVLRKHKTTFREIVAQLLQVPMRDVVHIPQPIATADLGLSDNILPLQFVIEAGYRDFPDVDVERLAFEILHDFESCDLKLLTFGVWLRCGEAQASVEHFVATGAP